MGETFGNILILGLAGIYFIIFNKIFRVFYFGFVNGHLRIPIFGREISSR